MIVGSVCSGIEAATVAWAPLGWQSAWYSEIEPFCCSLLNHYYPETPNLGDMTAITEGDLERHDSIDLLVGGTPCQSFSVAGLRKGLDDPRGNLALRFLQLARATRARWVVFENVPGLLSSGKGRDFGAFLGGLAELGYGWAYRILDAQYFGVPQRRRRVFVVGYLGDWRRAAAVLFERESLRRNPPPSREAGTGVAACFTAGAHPGGHNGQDDHKEGRLVVGALACNTGPGGHDAGNFACNQAVDAGHVIPIHNTAIGNLDRDRERDGAGIGEPGDPMYTLGERPREAIAFDTTQVTSPVNYSNPKPGDPCHPLASGQHPPAVAFEQNQRSELRDLGDIAGSVKAERGTNNQTFIAFDCKRSGEGGEVSPPLRALSHDKSHANAGGQVAVALKEPNIEKGVAGARRNSICAEPEDPMFTLGASHEHGVWQGMAVRRLTPEECEKLQGFSPGYTKIPYRNKPADKCPDGPRYRALGNSMAVPVMRWIGERIIQVEELTP